MGSRSGASALVIYFRLVPIFYYRDKTREHTIYFFINISVHSMFKGVCVQVYQLISRICEYVRLETITS